MIGRTEALLNADPRRVDLDAELREAKRATRRAEMAINRHEQQEARRIAAAPLPAVSPVTARALKTEALRRRGMSPDQIADLMMYSRSRELREAQTGPDGHIVISGR